MCATLRVAKSVIRGTLTNVKSVTSFTVKGEENAKGCINLMVVCLEKVSFLMEHDLNQSHVKVFIQDLFKYCIFHTR